MKKVILTLTLVLSCLMVFTGMAGCNRSSKETIRVGTSAVTRPHTFMDNDELTGYDIEVIRELATRIPGAELEFVYGNMTELQELLRTDRIDIIVNNVAKNAARLEEFIFSENGYVFNETFLVVNGNDTRTTLDQFEGAIMGGTDPGNWFYRMLDEYNQENGEPFAEIRSYENYDALFMDIDLGRIDGTVNDSPIVAFSAEAMNLNIKYVGEVLDAEFSFFMMQNSDKGRDLKAKIDKALGEAISDGKLLEISMEWFGRDMTHER